MDGWRSSPARRGAKARPKRSGSSRRALSADRAGPIRALVNNAAIHWVRPLVEETLDGLLQMMAVNLGGVFLGMRSVLEPMSRAGGGSIVNISSIAGMTGFTNHGAYGASKWAIRGITKTAALEFAPFGVRVNSVHPGAVNTLMAGDTSVPGRFDRVPLKRSAEPAEVADLVLFLASDASAYVTGAELVIDGGASAGVNAAPS
jgi:3alpha(or 20beta)-hydroxysteroid dehydrogenase